MLSKESHQKVASKPHSTLVLSPLLQQLSLQPEIISGKKISLLPLNNNATDDTEQEEQEEEEASEKPNQLKAKLKDTGFSKSFILSLIYELGSKDLKVKLIEDQTESIEDKDIDKLKELANEDSIIFEEEQPELSCPKLPESINCPGDSC